MIHRDYDGRPIKLDALVIEKDVAIEGDDRLYLAGVIVGEPVEGPLLGGDGDVEFVLEVLLGLPKGLATVDADWECLSAIEREIESSC